MMTETLEPMATEVDPKQLAEQLLAQAKEQGIDLVGPDGLLNRLTKNVLETALEAEMTEHLGYDKHDPAVSGTSSACGRAMAARGRSSGSPCSPRSRTAVPGALARGADTAGVGDRKVGEQLAGFDDAFAVYGERLRHRSCRADEGQAA